MNKKKILFVIETLNIGGAEISLMNLLDHFDYENYDVYLQLLSLPSHRISLLNKKVKVLPPLNYISFLNGKTLEYIKNLKNLPLKWILARYLFSILLRLRPNLKKEELDSLFWCVNRNSFVIDHDSYDVAIAYSQGIPTYYVHDKVNASKKLTWMNAKYDISGKLKTFNKNFYNNFDKIVTVSSNLRNYLTNELFPEFLDKTVVFPDLINIKKIKALSLQKIKEEIKRKPLIVTVARYNWAKGYEFAIKAAEVLKKRNFEFVWLAIGYGPLEDKLKQMIQQFGLEDQFHLLGAKDNPYPYMKQCDIYMQPSRHEGFGLTIAEAKILCKPVICTPFEGHEVQIKDGINGLVSSFDPADIADKIERLTIDKSLYENIVRNLANEEMGNKDEIMKLYNLIDG